MIRLFISKHMAVFSLSVLIIILGIISYVTLPRETNPDIKIPYIIVSTTYIGVSASDIEALITEPIETELEGMNGLNDLTSESRQNFFGDNRGIFLRCGNFRGIAPNQG